MLGKLFEKILLKMIHPIILEKGIIPNIQCGFRPKHSTINQIHRLTDTIITVALEKKQYCTSVFLAFDRVWHVGLVCKLKKIFPVPYFLLLKL